MGTDTTLPVLLDKSGEMRDTFTFKGKDMGFLGGGGGGGRMRGRGGM